MVKTFTEQICGVYRGSSVTIYVCIFVCIILTIYLFINIEYSLDFNSNEKLAKFYLVSVMLLILSFRTLSLAKLRIVITKKLIEISYSRNRQKKVHVDDIELVTAEGGDMTLHCKDGPKVSVPSFGGANIIRLFRDELTSMGIDYREFITD